MSLIFGVDPSYTSTGWAVFDSKNKSCVNWGTIKTTTKNIDIIRFLYIKRELKRLLTEYSIDKASCEAPIFGGYETGTLFTIYIFLQEVLLECKIDTVFFAPTQIKKMLSEEGYGIDNKIFKSESVRAAKEYLNDILPGRPSGDKADAFNAARLGARFWDFADGNLTLENLTAAEKHMFAREHTFIRGKKKGLTERTGIIFRENELFFRFSKLNLEELD